MKEEATDGLKSEQKQIKRLNSSVELSFMMFTYRNKFMLK